MFQIITQHARTHDQWRTVGGAEGGAPPQAALLGGRHINSNRTEIHSISKMQFIKRYAEYYLTSGGVGGGIIPFRPGRHFVTVRHCTRCRLI